MKQTLAKMPQVFHSEWVGSVSDSELCVLASCVFAWITPRDSMRRRVFIAPLGLWLTLDAGTFSVIEIWRRHRSVRVFFNKGAQASKARLRIEQPAKIAGVGTIRPLGQFPIDSPSSPLQSF